MDDRQDIYSGRRIEWRWIGVGVLVVTGLATLLAAVAAAIGVDVTSLGILLPLTTLAFGLGGTLVGMLSPGYTAWEAGIASLLAAGAAIVLASRLLDFAEGLMVALPFAALWGLLCGLAGGWLGERLQGSQNPS